MIYVFFVDLTNETSFCDVFSIPPLFRVVVDLPVQKDAEQTAFFCRTGYILSFICINSYCHLNHNICVLVYAYVVGTADSNRTQASCAHAALLSSRTAMPDACMKHSIYFVRRGESNPAANNPCPVCLSTPSVRLSRLPDCHVSGLWGAGSRTPDNLCRVTFTPLAPPLRRRHPESILRYLVSSAICSLSAASTNFGQFMTITTWNRRK